MVLWSCQHPNFCRHFTQSTAWTCRWICRCLKRSDKLVLDIAANIEFPLLADTVESRKLSSVENLAKANSWTSLPLKRFVAPLRRTVVDFGRNDVVPHVAANE